MKVDENFNLPQKNLNAGLLYVKIIFQSIAIFAFRKDDLTVLYISLICMPMSPHDSFTTPQVVNYGAFEA